MCTVVVVGSGTVSTTAYAYVEINGETVTSEGTYEVAKGETITCVAKGEYSSSNVYVYGRIYLNGEKVKSATSKVTYDHVVTGTTVVELTAGVLTERSVKITTV